jgi:hypothetical protein
MQLLPSFSMLIKRSMFNEREIDLLTCCLRFESQDVKHADHMTVSVAPTDLAMRHFGHYL